MIANMDWRIQRVFLFSVFILITVVVPHSIKALSGEKHTKDMVAVSGATEDELVELVKELSEAINEIDPRPDSPEKRFPGKHRVYFHWGFSDAIPRDHLNKAVDAATRNNPGLSRAEAQRIIVEEWQRRINHIIDLTEKLTGLPRTQAKGVAGILYYTHLFGDYTTSDKDGLRALGAAQRDLQKNINRVFGNNSATAVEINQALEEAFLKKGSNEQKAKRLLAVMKEKVGPALAANKGVFAHAGKADSSTTVRAMMILSSPTSTRMSVKWASITKTYDSMFRDQPRLKTAAGAGLTAAIFSSVGHGFRAIRGEEELGEAVLAVGKDTSMAGTSAFLAEGMMVAVEGKWVLLASCKALKSGVGGGIAVFIFDETRTVFNFVEGDMTIEQFVKETGKNTTVGLASGTAVYCTVLMGANPVGLSVYAVAIGTEIVVNYAWSRIENEYEQSFVFMEDLIGRMPLEVLNRRSFWQPEQWERKPAPIMSELPFEKKLPYSSELPFKAIYDSTTGYEWE